MRVLRWINSSGNFFGALTRTAVANRSRKSLRDGRTPASWFSMGSLKLTRLVSVIDEQIWARWCFGKFVFHLVRFHTRRAALPDSGGQRVANELPTDCRRVVNVDSRGRLMLHRAVNGLPTSALFRHLTNVLLVGIFNGAAPLDFLHKLSRARNQANVQ